MRRTHAWLGAALVVVGAAWWWSTGDETPAQPPPTAQPAATHADPAFAHANWKAEPAPASKPEAKPLRTPPPAAHIEGGGVVEFRKARDER